MRRQPQGSFIRKNANVFNGGGRLYCELHADLARFRVYARHPLRERITSVPQFFGSPPRAPAPEFSDAGSEEEAHAHCSSI
jgi:hypothetical protein